MEDFKIVGGIELVGHLKYEAGDPAHCERGQLIIGSQDLVDLLGPLFGNKMIRLKVEVVGDAS